MIRCLWCLLWLFHAGLNAATIEMPSNTPRPLKVGIAVFVNDIGKINDHTGSFEASLDIRQRWKDTGLAFDRKQMGLNHLDFEHEKAVEKLATIWTPELVLANATVQSMDQGLFIEADGTVTLIKRVKAVFDTRLQLAAFPFDTQALTIRIVSQRANYNQLALTQNQQDIDHSGLSKSVGLSEWQVQRLRFEPLIFRGWDGQYYPEMQVKIVLNRQPAAELLIILMPFFLVMLVPTVGTLYTRVDTERQLGFWASSILALVALSFTFTARYAMLPSGSLIMQLIVIGSVYQLIMILLTITLFNRQATERWSVNRLLVDELTGYLRWSIPPLLIGLVLTRVLLTSLL